MSQKPGVAYHEPLVEGRPGHGEGHNSGQAVNIAAALALKELMQNEGLPGTLMLWPGIAEELLAGKAFQVRDGLFDGVDAVLFTHVGANLETGWGEVRGRRRVDLGRIRVPRRIGACRRCTVARTQRARCGRD